MELSNLYFSNGIIFNGKVHVEIIDELLGKEKDHDHAINVDDIIQVNNKNLPLLSNHEVAENIEITLKDLKDNPAVDPVKLNKVQFYRNKYIK